MTFALLMKIVILISIAWFFINLLWKLWFEMLLFVGAITWFVLCIIYNPFNQAQVNVLLFIVLPLLGFFGIFSLAIPKKYKTKTVVSKIKSRRGK